MKIFIASFVIFCLCVLGMALGVIFSNKCIQGSCGGLGKLKKMFGGPSCEACENNKELELKT
ncbi:MAG: (Na+)-NQR maturation NqrM [SAR324 cluster bacterium]|nr:(Na+)-NQR maturation NqrM [SAR324 cluster bacterium]MBF0352822.1 (Na+)-NQR maturation NqrM [SAR324 cluster bacterium]